MNNKIKPYMNNRFFLLLATLFVGVFSFWYFTRTSVAIIGDSITAEGTIIRALRYKYKMYNCGVSGTTITNTRKKSFVERVNDIPNADVIVIYGGINDFNNGVSLGKFEDGWSNDTTFYGALHKCIRILKSSHPNSNFLLCTPMHEDFALKGYKSRSEYILIKNKIEPVHYGGGYFDRLC